MTIKTFIYLLSLVCNQICFSGVPTRLLVTRVGPCYDAGPGVVSVSEMKLVTNTFDSTLSGTLNITQEIEEGWIIKARMQKCHDIRNQDTCDHFKWFTLIRNGCSDDEEDAEDKQLITMFLHYVHPPLECPLKPGVYNITDYPFFADDTDISAVESKISTSVFGYSFRLEAFDSDEETRLMCVDAYIRMLYVRKHNWLASDTVTAPPAAAAPPTAAAPPAAASDEDDNDER